MSDVLVFFHNGPSNAMVGPLGAYEMGDEVAVPPRAPKFGDKGLPGFTGTVTQIATDGAATVTAPLADAA